MQNMTDKESSAIAKILNIWPIIRQQTSHCSSVFHEVEDCAPNEIIDTCPFSRKRMVGGGEQDFRHLIIL